MKAIVYTDGGVRTGGLNGPTKGKTGRGSAGCAIYEDEDGAKGRCLLRGGMLLDGSVTVNEAEYSAIIMGLYNARVLGATHVILYTDSQLVVNQINGKWRCKQPHLQEYLDEVMIEIEDEFDHVELHWIPREMNQVADEETRKILDVE